MSIPIREGGRRTALPLSPRQYLYTRLLDGRSSVATGRADAVAVGLVGSRGSWRGSSEAREGTPEPRKRSDRSLRPRPAFLCLGSTKVLKSDGWLFLLAISEKRLRFKANTGVFEHVIELVRILASTDSLSFQVVARV